jgi:hypothetical protein
MKIKKLQNKIHPSVRWQWDPGISTATAWGQAVFRGGGNVMTHVCHGISPLDISPRASPTWHQPSSAVPTYQRGSNRYRHRRIFRIKVRVHPLPPAILSEDDSGEPSPVFSAATPCARAHVPVVAHRWLRAVTHFILLMGRLLA